MMQRNRAGRAPAGRQHRQQHQQSQAGSSQQDQNSNNSRQADQDDQDAIEAFDEAEGRHSSQASGSNIQAAPPTFATGSAQSEHVVDWADDIAKTKYKKRYNVAPRCYSPIVRRDPKHNGHYLLEGFQWGLTPHWAKEPPTSPQHTINATCEKVKERASMWASMRDKKRCIVVAEGFFEWQTTRNQKRAHFVKPKNGLMLMAGLWDIATFGGQYDELRTFTIITVPVSAQLRFLHNRMPAILEKPEELKEWLSDKPWDESLSKLLRPYENELVCYQVTPEVGNVRNDDPSFIQPLAEKKGTIANMFAAQASASTSGSKSKKEVEGPSPKKAEKEVQQSKLRSSVQQSEPEQPAKLEYEAAGSQKESTAKTKRKADRVVEVLELDSDENDDDLVKAPPAKKSKKVQKEKSPVKKQVLEKASSQGKGKKKQGGAKLETDDHGNAVMENFLMKKE
ncbi:hypothetical protein ACM66B_005463 [Microbotryomycetes sp. NB124-2]